MRFATSVDVEETATGSTVGPAEVAWQMTAHEVRALGGLGWGGSLVLRSKSKGLSELLDGARACIPHEVFPRFDDSAVDLRCRLRDSDFLDDIHCLKGGKGQVDKVLYTVDTRRVVTLPGRSGQARGPPELRAKVAPTSFNFYMPGG